MPCTMENPEHNDRVGPKNIENTVWETVGQESAHLGSSTQTSALAGIGHDSSECGLNVGKELRTQPSALLVKPECGLGDVLFCQCLDDEPLGHGRSLA